LDPTQSFFTAPFPDPVASDGETMAIVTATSQNPALKPERSKSYTVGFDLQPEAWSDFSLSVTYFNLTFEDRISTPPVVGGPFNLFFQRDVLGSFINEDPDIAEVERIFAEPLFFNQAGVSPVDIEAIVDLRPHNIGLTETSGLDVQLRKEFELTLGELGLFADSSFIFDLKTRPLPTSREVELLDRAFNPIDLRVRGGASLSKGPWSASIALNYMDDYVNDLVEPRATVDSWLTADLYVGFQTATMTIGVNVQNLADEDPPRLSGIGDSFLPNLGYDGVNASALGRIVSVSLRKKW
jgi:outer membrane receptor protein involved in Fe transport